MWSRVAQMQFGGRGEPSKDGRASPGDLVIRLMVQKHKHFERNGGDIMCPLALTPSEAMLGTVKEIRGCARRNTRGNCAGNEQGRNTHYISWKRNTAPRRQRSSGGILPYHLPKKTDKESKKDARRVAERGVLMKNKKEFLQELFLHI